MTKTRKVPMLLLGAVLIASLTVVAPAAPAGAVTPPVKSFDLAAYNALGFSMQPGDPQQWWNPCAANETYVQGYVQPGGSGHQGGGFTLGWEDNAVYTADFYSSSSNHQFRFQACEDEPLLFGLVGAPTSSGRVVSVEVLPHGVGIFLSPLGDATGLFTASSSAGGTYERVGSQIDITVPMSYSIDLGGAPWDRAGSFTAHFHFSAAEEPFVVNGGSFVGVGECVDPACVGTGSAGDPGDPPPAPTTLTLAASQAKAAPGTSVTLTATASQAVSGADRILIFDPGAPGPLAQCATTATCTTSVSLPSSGARSFIAYIAPSSTSNPPPGAKAASNPTAVAWSVV